MALVAPERVEVPCSLRALREWFFPSEGGWRTERKESDKGNGRSRFLRNDNQRGKGKGNGNGKGKGNDGGKGKGGGRS